MTWQTEFGTDYAVPAMITAALDDMSWHNDACPSFGLDGEDRRLTDPATGDTHDLRLWVEHPDPERRESGGARYTVNYQPWSAQPAEDVIVTDYGQIYEGDDPGAALEAYARARDIIEGEILARQQG